MKAPLASADIQFAYSPRAQFVDFHNRAERWALLVTHRRAGKTFAIINDLVLKGLHTNKQDARYGYMAPYRTQAKEVAWHYLKQATNNLRDGAPREAELRVRLYNGAWITLYGADNQDALRGMYFDGLAVDEFGDTSPSLLGEVILPTLVDRKGWLVLSGTPKGRNQFYDAALKAEQDHDWYFKRMSADTSGIIPPEDLEQIRQQMSEEEYAQEMLVSFDAALKGTYYTTMVNDLQRKGQILDERLYDPEETVHVAADIGFSDSCAFWFWQPRPDGFALIDYHEAHGEKLGYYLKMLMDKGYDYEEIWLPHDARAKSLQTGKSTIEQLMRPHTVAPELFKPDDRLPLRLVPKLAVQHGIEAVRLILPMCWFDQAQCFKGIEALRTYGRRWDDLKKVYMERPSHTWASHGADGFRGFALVAKGSRGQSAEAISRERKGPQVAIKGSLQYIDGRIMTVETLEELAPLKAKLSLSRAARL